MSHVALKKGTKIGIGFFAVIALLALLVAGRELFLTGNLFSKGGEYKNLHASKDGVLAEFVLPKETFMLASVNMQDEKQMQNLAVLKKYWMKEEVKEEESKKTSWNGAQVARAEDDFEAVGVKDVMPALNKMELITPSSEGLGAILKSPATMLTTNFLGDLDNLEVELANQIEKDWGVDYETEIKPIFSNKTRLVFATAKLSLGKKDPTSEKELEEEVVPYFIINVEDKAKLNSLFQKLAEDKKMDVKKTDYRNLMIWQLEADVYLLPIEDLLVVSNSIEALKKAIDTYRSDDGSLYGVPRYQKTIEVLPISQFAKLYIDLENVMDLTLMEDLNSFYKGGLQFKGGALDLVETETIYVSLEKEGVRIKVYLTGNESEIDASETSFLEYKGESLYLDKLMPGENVIFYGESSNLRKSLTEVIDLYNKNEITKEIVTKMDTMIKSLNLDPKSDLATWLGKGFAYSIQQQEGLLPGITIVIDAQEDTGAAKRVYSQLDDLVFAYMVSLKKTLGPMGEALERYKKEGNKTLISFDGTLIDTDLDEGVDPLLKELKDKKFALHFGVTGGGKFFISTLKDFESAYDSSLNLVNSEKYEMVLHDITGYLDAGVFYMDITQLVSYLDVLAGKDTDSEVLLPQLEVLKMLKEYVAPLKSLVFGSKVDKYSIEGVGFLRIGEPEELEK